MGQLKYWNTSTSTWDTVDVGGEGVPNGGTTGQYLRKSSSTDYDTAWDTINLGTDTDGNYVAAVSAGNGISVSGTAGEGYTATVATKFHGCYAYRSSTSFATANNTFTDPVDMNAELFDTDGYHSNSVNNSRITIPSGLAGYYTVSVGVTFTGNATGLRAAYVRKTSGGTLTHHAGSITTNTGATTNHACTATCTLYLDVGDYVEAGAFQTSGGTLNAIAGERTFISVAYNGA